MRAGGRLRVTRSGLALKPLLDWSGGPKNLPPYYIERLPGLPLVGWVGAMEVAAMVDVAVENKAISAKQTIKQSPNRLTQQAQ